MKLGLITSSLFVLISFVLIAVLIPTLTKSNNNVKPKPGPNKQNFAKITVEPITYLNGYTITSLVESPDQSTLIVSGNRDPKDTSFVGYNAANGSLNFTNEITGNDLYRPPTNNVGSVISNVATVYAFQNRSTGRLNLMYSYFDNSLTMPVPFDATTPPVPNDADFDSFADNVSCPVIILNDGRGVCVCRNKNTFGLALILFTDIENPLNVGYDTSISITDLAPGFIYSLQQYEDSVYFVNNTTNEIMFVPRATGTISGETYFDGTLTLINAYIHAQGSKVYLYLTFASLSFDELVFKCVDFNDKNTVYYRSEQVGLVIPLVVDEKKKRLYCTVYKNASDVASGITNQYLIIDITDPEKFVTNNHAYPKTVMDIRTLPSAFVNQISTSTVYHRQPDNKFVGISFE